VKTNANREIIVPTIPSDLNEEWETVKENTSGEIPIIPSDLNIEWETVKENASGEIPIIPSDLNEEWETVKENANKVSGIESSILQHTFRQSLFDHTIMNNLNNNLYDKITCGVKFSTTMKTLTGGDVYPKKITSIFLH
jgi:hypothetical protein